MAETSFLLIRHATTLWNEEDRIQGQNDSPLSPEGERRALAWGEALANDPLDRILASDLGRTRATAGLVNRSLGLPIVFDPRLREQDWGEWVGMVRHDIPKLDPRFRVEAAKGWGFTAPGGESRDQVLARARQALAEAAERAPGGKILVVTHEGVIRCLLYKLLGRAYLASEPKVLEAPAVHQLIMDNGRLSLGRINRMLPA